MWPRSSRRGGESEYFPYPVIYINQLVTPHTSVRVKVDYDRAVPTQAKEKAFVGDCDITTSGLRLPPTHLQKHTRCFIPHIVPTKYRTASRWFFCPSFPSVSRGAGLQYLWQCRKLEFILPCWVIGSFVLLQAAH